MTFEQFQNTRQWADDVGEATGTDYGTPLSGFVYDGGLHIFAIGGGAAPDLYQLVINSEEKVSESLSDLERDLFQFGVDEGVLH